ncbi:unnamed protein product, partial [marine sediment metagenome]
LYLFPLRSGRVEELPGDPGASLCYKRYAGIGCHALLEAFPGQISKVLFTPDRSSTGKNQDSAPGPALLE